MDWKDYSDLKNSHAFLGGSNYAWRNYDFEKLEKMIIASYANSIGTAIHEYAAKNIKAKLAYEERRFQQEQQAAKEEHEAKVRQMERECAAKLYRPPVELEHFSLRRNG